MMLHDEGPCFCPRALRASILLTHYGSHARPAKPWGTCVTRLEPQRRCVASLHPARECRCRYYDDNFLADKAFYKRHIGDPASPTACISRGKDLVIPPWKVPSFWRKAFRNKELQGADAATRTREGIVFFAGDLGFRRLKGYSHDLRQRTHALYCNPATTPVKNCTSFVYGCREEIPQTCALWRKGVKVTQHSQSYHRDLMEHTFCLAFPGDGWSSRVLDAVVHGCIPVVVEDDASMFLEGALGAAGLGFDYEAFSVRVAEGELDKLLDKLGALPPDRVVAMRRAVLRVRDYFVYKVPLAEQPRSSRHDTPAPSTISPSSQDMYNPSRDNRAALLGEGQRGQDAFLLLALALEERARSLGKLPRASADDAQRHARMLGGGAVTADA
jgi:hypothetical protein